jgi:hypothetical protein
MIGLQYARIVGARVARPAVAVHLKAMDDAAASSSEDRRPIEMRTAPDGTLTYLVDVPPESLPPVRLRDLSAAWDAARAGAIAERWGPPRLFRFQRRQGEPTDLALADQDACCWAEAVDRTLGMRTPYGMSVCLRLLALVDLLSQARWAAPMVALERDGARLQAPLLSAAARLALTPEARFDQTGFRTEILGHALPAPPPHLHA